MRRESDASVGDTMVDIFLPTTADMGSKQERGGTPSDERYRRRVSEIDGEISQGKGEIY